MQRHAWRLGAGALCAASGLGLQSWVGLISEQHAHCDAAEQPAATAAAAAAAAKSSAASRDVAALANWLRQQGADVEGIEFKQSDKDAGRYGVYAADGIRQRAARGWFGTAVGWAGVGRNANITVAGFPLTGTLTAANLVRHPQHGAILQELLQLGLADERVAVILHLAVERQRMRQPGTAASSALQPWLALLPTSFSTTLFFSELDMQWLRGTTLYKATRLRQKALRDSWARLEPAARQMCERAGVAGAPSFEDFIWAHSIFWSRAIAFPSPATDGGEGVVMQEGIVPGLDFCNHDSASACKWTVFGNESSRQLKQQPPTAVSLICPRRQLPSAGQEITINYGDKSNEELLFLYGFALPNNPAEVLTVMCPLPPPAEWDALLQARLLLLQRRGLRPQLHLPAAELRAAGTQAAGSKVQAAGMQVLASDLPEGVMETLEVFVMDAQQVQQELAAAEAVAAVASPDSPAAGTAAASGAGGREMERSGQRMAVLTTLVRLLEVKALEMEGEEGSGPLENDEQLLAAAGASLPPNQRHALIYRIGQKQVARDYLAHAKQLLQQEMTHLARLQG